MISELVLVDENGKKIGYGTYDKCHTGRGRRHRAFVTLLFDKDDNVLLQRRKHRLFDGLWDLTAISHPLHINGRDESYQEASNRALQKEMSISNVRISEIGAFNYFAKDGENCENEYCAILAGNFDGAYKPNKNEVYETKEVNFQEFLTDIEKNPKKYTRWAVLASKILREQKPNLFKKELQIFLNLYNPYAANFYSKRIKETKKYSPIIADLYKNLTTFSQGGKKLRAFFVHLGYKVGSSNSHPGGRSPIGSRDSIASTYAKASVDKSLQNDTSEILPISLAFEMTQNFLLIHDDIIDNSDLRRGKPTIHKVYEKKHGRHYGEGMAITLGDIAAIETFKIISDSDFSDKQKAICLEEFSKVLLETAYGQSLDLEYSFEKADILQIYKIADLKAARYSVVAPLFIGASLAGAKDVQKDAIVHFGLNAGLVFQLQDDYLGLFGEEMTIGKSALSDMREGKNTVLIFKTKEIASVADKEKIEQVWGKADASIKDLEIIRGIVKKSGALEWCNNENKRLIAKSKKEIAKITKDNDLRIIFAQIADFIASREK